MLSIETASYTYFITVNAMIYGVLWIRTCALRCCVPYLYLLTCVKIFLPVKFLTKALTYSNSSCVVFGTSCLLKITELSFCVTKQSQSQNNESMWLHSFFAHADFYEWWNKRQEEFWPHKNWETKLHKF